MESKEQQIVEEIELSANEFLAQWNSLKVNRHDRKSDSRI